MRYAVVLPPSTFEFDVFVQDEFEQRRDLTEDFLGGRMPGAA